MAWREGKTPPSEREREKEFRQNFVTGFWLDWRERLDRVPPVSEQVEMLSIFDTLYDYMGPEMRQRFANKVPGCPP